MWTQPISAAAKDITLHYHITYSEDTFGTIFEMANEKVNFGSVVKSVFHLSPNYDSYDRYGLYQASGVCRMMTLGVIYPWASEIDIYDVHSRKIGMITGHVFCTERAKFSFFDAQEKCVYIASLDRNDKCFVIVDANDPENILARITCNTHVESTNFWDVTLYQPDLLPLKFLNIFAAFVSDSQNYFDLNL
jgi:hypothetical protein